MGRREKWDTDAQFLRGLGLVALAAIFAILVGVALIHGAALVSPYVISRGLLFLAFAAWGARDLYKSSTH